MAQPTAPERAVSHYRIVSSLGAGGMGEVYAAFDETLKRRVALKSIRADHRWSGDAKARFLREARLLSQLDHANVCRVYDYVEEDGAEWLVLELIEGQNLRELIYQGLDASRKMHIAEQIAAVLVATHAAGVIHRDLKPANVMVTRGGEVKVLDFGLAQPIAATAAATHATRVFTPTLSPDDVTYAATIAHDRDGPAGSDASIFRTEQGSLSGTLAYMSPEQASGEPATTASDMYSFGLLLQELFTGRPPYHQGLDAEALLERVRRADTPTPDGVGGDLTALIGRLKSVAPSQRPTAVEALERLRWLRGKPARRMRQTAIAAVVVAALAGAGKYTVDLARERATAVAARDEADRRRTQAEALIGFMLGNLRPRLQQVGRLDLLEEVGNEATAYFKAVPPEALSGEELYRRSQSLYQIGQVYQARGNLPQAVAAYHDSLALMRDVASRAPENAEWQMGLINAHFYLGDALRQQGDLPAALEQFRDYARVAERLLARSSTEPRWQMEVAYGRSNTAAVLEAQGDFESALKELQISLPLVQQVSQAAPDNREWRSALANQHNRTGVVLHRLGRLTEARDHYRQDLAITRQLLAAQSQDAPMLFRHAIGASWLASALEDLGDAEAPGHRRTQRDTLAALVARDASNTNWQREFAAAQMRRGDEADAQDGAAAALAVYREAFGSLLSLFKANPSRVTLRRDVAFGHARLARARLKTGQAAAAQIEANACQEVLIPLITGVSVDQEAVAQTAHCKLLIGAALHRQGEREQASQEWQRALTTIEPLTRHSNDPRRLQLLARALKHLGRDAEAAAVIDRILATGYRNRMFLQDLADTDSRR